MDSYLFFLLGSCIGIGVGVVITFLGRQRNFRAQFAITEARHASEVARIHSDETATRSELTAQLVAARALHESVREQLVAQHQRYDELVENTRREALARENQEQSHSKVLEALAPVRSSLQEMHQKVTDLENQRATQHGELTQQLRSTNESEERLRTTTESLASALRSNNIRGVWGETQLRNVVEAAGLIERVDFTVQSSITSDSGAGRPDMIVHLPGDKKIAVDAKVPFAAFLEASHIPPTATGADAAQRETLIKAHVKAVRDHITALGSKNYWDGLDTSPELVIAFIPSESLISSALHADPSLMDFAFTKRVALASPITLWSVLKTVAFTWQQDVVTQEAKTLFDLSRQLYNRLCTMAGHIDKLGRSVKATVTDYNKFVGSLERHVLPSARKLSMLDDTHSIPPHEIREETARPLTAFELLEELETTTATSTTTFHEDDPPLHDEPFLKCSAK